MGALDADMASYHVRFVLVLSLLSAVLALSKEAGTPSWVHICDSSYLFSEDSKSWTDASGNCELYGGHLWQVDNMLENYCILEYHNVKGLPADYYWHSGNDILSEGVFRQHDGSHILWQPIWYGDDPQGGTAENCLLVRLSADSSAGKWWDDPCTIAHRYVCERTPPP